MVDGIKLRKDNKTYKHVHNIEPSELMDIICGCECDGKIFTPAKENLKEVGIFYMKYDDR